MDAGKVAEVLEERAEKAHYRYERGHCRAEMFETCAGKECVAARALVAELRAEAAEQAEHAARVDASLMAGRAAYEGVQSVLAKNRADLVRRAQVVVATIPTFVPAAVESAAKVGVRSSGNGDPRLVRVWTKDALREEVARGMMCSVPGCMVSPCGADLLWCSQHAPSDLTGRSA